MMGKPPVSTRYIGVHSARMVLDKVEQWCRDWGVLLREKEFLWEFDKETEMGRLDGVIVPTSWKAPNYKSKTPFGLIGVEVKVSRSDFQRGLRSGQYERYAERVSGLYVAGPKGVVQKRELPRHIGVLIVGARGMSCLRHPQWQERKLTDYQIWRVLWSVCRRVDQRLQELDQAHYEMEQLFRRCVIAPAAYAVRKRFQG